MAPNRFRKYGEIFEKESDSDTPRPESPYESDPYVDPGKRPSALDAERDELAELRIGGKNHWD